MLKSCEIDFNNPPAKAEEVISAGDVPLGTQGNILCITGGEGTGKSNYVAALIAGSIRNDNRPIDTLGVDVRDNSDHKAVLLYDTEQSEVQLFKNVSNLLKRAKLEKNRKNYGLSPLPECPGKSGCKPLFKVWINTITNMRAFAWLLLTG